MDEEENDEPCLIAIPTAYSNKIQQLLFINQPDHFPQQFSSVKKQLT